MDIFSDGGSRGNPGQAACAFVAILNGKAIFKESMYLGHATNNFAEYMGVKLAINWLVKRDEEKGGRVNFYMDSELVVKQLNSEYKVKDSDLKIIFLEIKKIISENNVEVLFQYIPREKNKIADALVNECLDLRT